MIVLATHNEHKASEIAHLLKDLPWQLADPKWQFEETAPTLIGNAIGKALSAKKFAPPHHAVIAEDTGLFVPALNGAPGVLSARYAGETVSFEENIRKLLKEMAPLKGDQRKAVFLTVCALSAPDGRMLASCGRLEGTILDSEQGTNGFGYDPVFYIPFLDKTLAQMSLEEKNALSHRGLAFRAIAPHLNR